MTNKHTPGPWTTDTNGLITAGPRRLHIAQTAVTGMGHAAEANARLLAAAPDMLTALNLAALAIERNCYQQDIDPAADTEAQIVRAAIRKALEG